MFFAHHPALGEKYLFERSARLMNPQVDRPRFLDALPSEDLVPADLSQAGTLRGTAGNFTLERPRLSQAGTMVTMASRIVLAWENGELSYRPTGQFPRTVLFWREGQMLKGTGECPPGTVASAVGKSSDT